MQGSTVLARAMVADSSISQLLIRAALSSYLKVKLVHVHCSRCQSRSSVVSASKDMSGCGLHDLEEVILKWSVIDTDMSSASSRCGD